MKGLLMSLTLVAAVVLLPNSASAQATHTTTDIAVVDVTGNSSDGCSYVRAVVSVRTVTTLGSGGQTVQRLFVASLTETNVCTNQRYVGSRSLVLQEGDYAVDVPNRVHDQDGWYAWGAEDVTVRVRNDQNATDVHTLQVTANLEWAPLATLVHSASGTFNNHDVVSHTEAWRRNAVATGTLTVSNSAVVTEMDLTRATSTYFADTNVIRMP